MRSVAGHLTLDRRKAHGKRGALRLTHTRILARKGTVAAGLLLALCPGVVADSAGAATVKIALLSDTHTNRSTCEDQGHYRDRLDKAIAAVNRERVDLVLIAGDLTDGGYPAEISAFKKQIQGAAGFKAPVWFVPGNHDVGNKAGCRKDPGPSVQTLTSIEQALGRPSFFARSVPNAPAVRIIGVNSPIIGSNIQPEADMWRLLESELKAPRPGVTTILLTHYPLYTFREDEPDSFWNVNSSPRRRLLSLLNQGHVAMVLSGHLHCALFIAGANGIAFVTTPPVSHFYNDSLLGWTLITVNGQAVDHEFRTLDGAPVSDDSAEGVCGQPDDFGAC